MKITPVKKPGSSCTGKLEGLTVEQINEILGFTSNCEDDPYKVVNSWGFTIKVNGKDVHCGVWDYKGSHKCNSFSTDGPHGLLTKLFGDKFKG